ncbi:multicopper oxidase family protein [Streptomyces sp. HUAS MG47]|uniref:multicopper oxidase family protein n=1 Tax=Streptomyces solicamelliae TaxID=3231716 RepID=UPI00387840AE
MVENLFEQNLLWAVLAAVFWAYAARGARCLAARRTTRAVRRRARLGLVLLSVSLLVLVLRVGLALALAGEAGRRAADDFVLFAAVPLTLAGAGVAVFAVPAYVRVVRRTAGSGGGEVPDARRAAEERVPAHAGRAAGPAQSGRASGEAAGAAGGAGARAAVGESVSAEQRGAGGGAVPTGLPHAAAESRPAGPSRAARVAADPVPAELRRAAADPRLVVPVRVCFATTVVAAALTLHPPAPSYTGPFLLELALLAVVAGALLLFQQRRRGDLAAPGWTPPSTARRMVRPTALVTAVALLSTGGCTLMWQESRLPATVGHAHAYDTGGGPAAGAAPVRDLAGLTGPRTEQPTTRFTLTATSRTTTLASGEKVAALAFNGSLPGPELRMKRGELVEVTLVNQNVPEGVTVHWHGVDVPNAEDGVAGVTQNAVRPGQRHVYRFRPPRAGTFWYHSHQQSSTVVTRGLFGALIVEEPGARPEGVDRTVVAHAWPVLGGTGEQGGPHRGGGGALSGRNGAGGLLRTAIGDDTRRRQEKVAAGTPVRLRLVNADNCPRTYSLAGTPYQVAAIDGNEVNGPTDLDGRLLRIAGGGRVDVTFRQPAGPVHLTIVGDANASGASHGFEGCGEDGAYGTGRTETASLLLDPSGTATRTPPAVTGPLFDPLHYGTRTTTPFGPGTRYDRDFHLVLGNSVGFFDGRPMMTWTINNAVYPDIPALLVKEGDTVRTSFVNRSLDDHPMHLHGHRMLVLSRDGEPATGSPWWTDTLNVAPGERYEVAFRADNPGVWMDHCHNLDHARDGMVLHLAYDGVTSPYEAGRSSGNLPE